MKLPCIETAELAGKGVYASPLLAILSVIKFNEWYGEVSSLHYDYKRFCFSVNNGIKTGKKALYNRKVCNSVHFGIIKNFHLVGCLVNIFIIPLALGFVNDRFQQRTKRVSTKCQKSFGTHRAFFVAAKIAF